MNSHHKIQKVVRRNECLDCGHVFHTPLDWKTSKPPICCGKDMKATKEILLIGYTDEEKEELKRGIQRAQFEACVIPDPHGYCQPFSLDPHNYGAKK
jgi:hypothetical protein